jgi:hypothetical protein
VQPVDSVLLVPTSTEKLQTQPLARTVTLKKQLPFGTDRHDAAVAQMDVSIIQ